MIRRRKVKYLKPINYNMKSTSACQRFHTLDYRGDGDEEYLMENIMRKYMQDIIRHENLKTGLSENDVDRSSAAPLANKYRSQKDIIKIHPDSTLLMIGDSITDCGRVSPAAEAVRDPLGYGYVKLIDNVLGAICPGQNIRILNRGVSGNTVRHLTVSWQSDVLDLKPDWLSILIGINDVWSKFDDHQPDEWHVSIDEYSSTLDHLIRTTRPQLRGIVLMTPYCIEPDLADPMRAMMDRYGEVVRQLAGNYQAILVDTQAAFESVLEELPPAALSIDRVHLKPAGHMILAQSFLKAVGCGW
jgi:lysophospholipase L1-like esterase